MVKSKSILSLPEVKGLLHENWIEAHLVLGGELVPVLFDANRAELSNHK